MGWALVVHHCCLGLWIGSHLIWFWLCCDCCRILVTLTLWPCLLMSAVIKMPVARPLCYGWNLKCQPYWMVIGTILKGSCRLWRLEPSSQSRSLGPGQWRLAPPPVPAFLSTPGLLWGLASTTCFPHYAWHSSVFSDLVVCSFKLHQQAPPQQY